MNTQDERFMLVIKALGLIEERIKKEENPANIKNSVTMGINYNERHFDRIFKSVIGCSLDEYIKDAAYIHAYESWRREKKKLSQKEGYKGVPHFSFYFKRRFGFSLNEAEDKGGEKMEPKVTQEELIQMKDYLEGNRWIDSYEMKEGKVHVVFDEDLLLLYALCHKTYILPVEMVKHTKWNELSTDGKKVFLICSSRAADGMKDHSMSIPAEEMMIEYECLDYYDLENPELMNGNLIYHVKLNDDFKPIFARIIDACFHAVSIMCVNGPQTPKKYREILDAINGCGGLVALHRIAAKSGKSQDQVVDILWEMAQKGILKIA